MWAVVPASWYVACVAATSSARCLLDSLTGPSFWEVSRSTDDVRSPQPQKLLVCRLHWHGW